MVSTSLRESTHLQARAHPPLLTVSGTVEVSSSAKIIIRIMATTDREEWLSNRLKTQELYKT